MPEDYQAILDDLGVDTSSGNTDGQQTGGQEQNPVNPQAGDNAGANATDPGDNNTGDDAGAQNSNQQTGDTDEQRRANEAFAAMRTENSKYKKFIQQIMKGADFQGDEEAFMNQLTEASYQRQAKRQGNQVSPELLKRMDSLENQNRTLLDAQNKQLFTANLKNMQETLNLKEEDIKEFVNLAVQEHIDLTIPGTNFVTLYQGLFFDKLKTRMIEEERQKWIAQNSKANGAANPDGKSGKKDPNPTNVNTMAEFDSLLQSIPTNKK